MNSGWECSRRAVRLPAAHVVTQGELQGSLHVAEIRLMTLLVGGRGRYVDGAFSPLRKTPRRADAAFSCHGAEGSSDLSSTPPVVR
jgi:hypothetical protein